MAAAVPGTDWTDGPETLNADETHEALLVALRQLEDRLTQDSALFKERHAATAEMNKYSPGASIPLPVSLLGREGKGLLENVFSPEELIQISSSTHSQDQSLEYVDNASERALERQIAASRRLALLYASDPSPRSTLIEATANIATLYAKRSMYTQAMERANDALSLTERLDEPQVDPNLLARLHIYVALGRISQSE